MCDYSLYSTQTRLAEDGEELLLHRFTTGTLGFASVADVTRCECQAAGEGLGFWSALKSFFLPQPRLASIPAVCIPPGSRLLLTDVPVRVQERFGIGSPEVAVFTEISSRVYCYRDALLFSNGKQVLLQKLPPGIRATVLSTTSEPVSKPEEVEVFEHR